MDIYITVCVICGFKKLLNEYNKYWISETDRATNFFDCIFSRCCVYTYL